MLSIKKKYPTYDGVTVYIGLYAISRAYSKIEDFPLNYFDSRIDIAIWSLLVNFHYSNDEKIALYCALFSDNGRRGLNRYSLRIFNKNLIELNKEEAHQIIFNAK